MTLLTAALAALSGGVVGFLLAAFGGGGSVLATPLLLYVVGVRDPHAAIGASAAAVTINAVAGLAMQARAGRVKWACATVFAGAGLAGALIGAQLAKGMDGGRLLAAFAGAMILVALSMLAPRRGDGDPYVHLTPGLTARLAPVGLGAGFAAGFFGIGGGFLIAPGLMAATGMTLANAAASSLVSVAVFGAATTASYAVSGLVDWTIVAVMVVGGVIGAAGGVRAARLLAAHTTLARQMLAALILATAAYIFWRSFI